MCVIWSATPAFFDRRDRVAAADDRRALAPSATACATALVPVANASISNTPIGPFQTTVFASRDAPRVARRSSAARCRAPMPIADRRRRRPRALRAARPPRASARRRDRPAARARTPRAFASASIVARRVELVVLDQRLADRHAARLEERVGHRAADEQRDRPCRAGSRSPRSCPRPSRRRGSRRTAAPARSSALAEVLELLLPSAGRRPLLRRSCTMPSADACARCAAPNASFDVDVGERGELLRERRRRSSPPPGWKRRFSSSTTCRRSLRLAIAASRAVADAVVGERRPAAPSSSASRVGDRPQADTPDSACPSAGRDGTRGRRVAPVLERVLDRRQRRADARVVADRRRP